MNFCSACGAKVSHRVPPGDSLPRHVCDACGVIHYRNPRLVVGALPEWEDRVLLCRRAIEPRHGKWTLPAGFMENGESVADAARREVARTFVWALPQVARDGFVAFDGEDDVQAFDAVDFPLAIGREAMVATEFSTHIVSSPSGHEQRASEWAEARMRYDAGPGVRSESDVRALADFFAPGAARRGRFASAIRSTMARPRMAGCRGPATSCWASATGAGGNSRW